MKSCLPPACGLNSSVGRHRASTARTGETSGRQAGFCKNIHVKMGMFRLINEGLAHGAGVAGGAALLPAFGIHPGREIIHAMIYPVTFPLKVSTGQASRQGWSASQTVAACRFTLALDSDPNYLGVDVLRTLNHQKPEKLMSARG